MIICQKQGRSLLDDNERKLRNFCVKRFLQGVGVDGRDDLGGARKNINVNKLFRNNTKVNFPTLQRYTNL